jgi:hypothetical protein
MNLDPPAAPNLEAPVCRAGQPINLFFDDLENTASGNWTPANGLKSKSLVLPTGPEPVLRRYLRDQRHDEHVGLRPAGGRRVLDRHDQQRGSSGWR